MKKRTQRTRKSPAKSAPKKTVKRRSAVRAKTSGKKPTKRQVKKTARRPVKKSAAKKIKRPSKKKEVLTYSSLIDLYNDGHDFATKLPNGRYRPELLAKKATHKILCTQGLEIVGPDFNANRPYKDATKIGGFAESVAAVPLSRELKKSRLKLKRPLPRAPKNWPPYKTDMTLPNKRRCLMMYARLTGCVRRYEDWINEWSNEQCDYFLKEFVRASRLLRFELGKKNKAIGFWDKWKKADAPPEPLPIKPAHQYPVKPRKHKFSVSINLTRATVDDKYNGLRQIVNDPIFKSGRAS